MAKFIFSSMFYYKVAIEFSEPLGEKSNLNIEFVSAQKKSSYKFIDENMMQHLMLDRNSLWTKIGRKREKSAENPVGFYWRKFSTSGWHPRCLGKSKLHRYSTYPFYAIAYKITLYYNICFANSQLMCRDFDTFSRNFRQ